MKVSSASSVVTCSMGSSSMESSADSSGTVNDCLVMSKDEWLIPSSSVYGMVTSE